MQQFNRIRNIVVPISALLELAVKEGLLKLPEDSALLQASVISHDSLQITLHSKDFADTGRVLIFNEYTKLEPGCCKDLVGS